MKPKEIDKIETEMETAVRDALKEGKVPSECIQEVEVTEDMYVNVVVFHEC